MIKLIASDLDGTLVDGNMAALPEKFPKIVRALKEKGILFAAASGRQYHNLRQLFESVKDDIAYICENGALTVYQGKILHKVEIPLETAVSIIRRLQEESGTEVLVSGAFTSYIRPKEPLFEEYIKGMKNQYKVVSDLTDIGEPIIKLALFEKEGTETASSPPASLHTVLSRLPVWGRRPDCETGKDRCTPSEAYPERSADPSKTPPRFPLRSW